MTMLQIATKYDEKSTQKSHYKFYKLKNDQTVPEIFHQPISSVFFNGLGSLNRYEACCEIIGKHLAFYAERR